MSSFLADPFAFVQCIGAFFLGFKLYEWLKAHPKLVHLDDEHLFIAASLPIMLMLFLVAANWLFVFAFLALGWVAMVIMGFHILLFVVGFLKIVHWFFQTFGAKKKAG